MLLKLGVIMKLKFQIIFFTLLLGLAGCFEDDDTEQAASEEREQAAFSPADADKRLETVIDNLEEEEENKEEEQVSLEEYLEEQEVLKEEQEEFLDDEEYEPLPEDIEE
jgi:hypothetical protein